MNNAQTPLLDGLIQRGWGTDDALVSPQLSESLRREALAHLAQQRTEFAGIGKDKHRQRAIRHTHIKWFDPDQMSDAEGELWQLLDALRQQLRQECLLSLVSIECHFAIYPVGAYYKRHLDQFREDSSRALSFVLYLNPSWVPEHEGELRLFMPEGEAVDVAPSMGNFVLFRSDQLEHEVRTTHAERLCVVGWMKTPSKSPF